MTSFYFITSVSQKRFDDMSYKISESLTIATDLNTTSTTPYTIQLDVNNLSVVPNNNIFNKFSLLPNADVFLFANNWTFENPLGGTVTFATDPTVVDDVIIELPVTNPSGPYQTWVTDLSGRLEWGDLYQVFQNQRDVCKNPNPLQYPTIGAALGSLLFTDPLTPTAIYVHPGVYQEVDTLTIPSNVYVIGIGEQPVVIEPAWVSPERPLFQFTGGGGNNGLAFLTMDNGTDNAYCVELNDPGDFTLFFKCSFNGWKNCFHANGESSFNYVYLEYVSTNFDDENVGNVSVFAECNNNSFLSVGIENGFFFGPCNNHVHFTGSNLECLYSASTIQNIDEFTNFPYGNGVKVENGGHMTLRGMYIEGMDNAIFVPPDSTLPNIDLLTAGLIFDDNIMNFNFQSNNVIGNFNGYSDYTKTHIPKNSGFFITNTDNNIVTVAKKGGNFSSVKQAIDYIYSNKQPSSTNSFLVTVGPGIFVEDPIQMYQWISIEGENKFLSVIEPSSTTATVLTGNVNCSLESIQLRGATGSGGKLLAYNGSTASLTTFRVQDIFFGSANTLVSLTSDSGPCGFSALQFLISSSAQFHKGFEMSGTTFPFKSVISGVSWFTSTTSPTFDTFIDCDTSSTSYRDKMYFTQLFGGSETLNLGGTGIKIDGATSVVVQGGALAGFNNGVVVPSGSAFGPSVTVGGFSLMNNQDYDIVLENPNTSGLFNIVANTDKVFFDPAITNVTYVVASNTGELDISAKLFQGPIPSAVTWVSEQWQKGGVTGLMSGSLSAVFSTRTVSVSAGTGYVALNTVTPLDQLIRHLEWGNLSVILPAVTGDYYIFIDHNNSLQQSLTQPILTENIVLGRARVEEVTPAVFQIVWLLDETQTALNPVPNLTNAFRSLASPLFVSGCVVNATEVGTNVNITSGSLYWGNQPISPTQLLSANFIGYTPQDVSATATGISYTTGVPRVWSNNGVVTNLTTDEWTKQSIYLSGQSTLEQAYLIIGDVVYPSSSDALTNAAPVAPGFINEAIFKLADVVVTGNNSINLTNDLIIDQRPFLATGGGSSSSVSTTLDHNSLLNLPVGDVHTQYLPANGSRPMTGDLDMGTNDITNAGTYNGVTVQAHASRHQPGGADPIPTASAIEITDFTNSEGTSSFLTRSDHTHAHGMRGGGNLHAVVTTSANGFMSTRDKIILDEATPFALQSTLVRRDVTSSAGFANVELVNTSTNVATRLVTAPSTAANYNFIFPDSVGAVGQILTSQGATGTIWSNNSVFIDPTSQFGDMIARNATDLVAVKIPTAVNTAGGNLQYNLTTGNNLFPQWSIQPFDPIYTMVELEDFIGAATPFASFNWRSQAASGGAIVSGAPAVGNPIGCVQISTPNPNGILLLTRGTTASASTMSFSTTSTVYFEVTVNTDLLVAAGGTSLALGFGNMTNTVAPTQFVSFLFNGTTAGTTSPIVFTYNNATVAFTSAVIANATANQWIKLRFVVYGLTQLYVYANDVQIFTQTPLLASFPSTTRMSPYIRQSRSGAGVSRTSYIDYVHWGQFFNSSRRYTLLP